MTRDVTRIMEQLVFVEDVRGISIAGARSRQVCSRRSLVSRTTRFVVLASAITAFAGATFPREAHAQQRAVPRTHGRSVVVVGAGYHYPYYARYVYPYYYGPFFYGGFYPAFWGWQYPYPPYRYAYFDNRGSARLQVTPRNA